MLTQCFKPLRILILIMILSLLSCATASLQNQDTAIENTDIQEGTEGEMPDTDVEPTPDYTHITLTMDLFPEFFNQDESVYTGYCYIADSSDTSRTDFSDAVVRVNGEQIEFTHEPNYLFMYGIEGISVGDRVTFSIEHSVFGRIEASAVVPPALDGFISYPDLPKSGTANEEDFYVLSWEDLDNTDCYFLAVYAFEDAGGDLEIMSDGFFLKDNKYVFDKLSGHNGVYPYIEFELESVNQATFKGLSENSVFSVSSPRANLIRNSNYEL